MAQLGKRYVCGQCGGEVVCTKQGEGVPDCCDQSLEVKATEPLPSSD